MNFSNDKRLIFRPVACSSESSPPEKDEDDDRVENAGHQAAHQGEDLEHYEGPGQVGA